jgi:hypothetical protein
MTDKIEETARAIYIRAVSDAKGIDQLSVKERANVLTTAAELCFEAAAAFYNVAAQKRG